MIMKVQLLDCMLVPGGLMVMAGYHLWLLHRIMKHPTKTVIGINALNRRFWVHAMMEDLKNGVLAVQSLRNNIMASTLLASTAITLSSVIAVMMSGEGGTANESAVVIGDRSQLGFSIKFFCILVCFLLAFLLNVQSIRYYSHASILVNVPIKKLKSSPYLTAEYVGKLVNRGSYFWSLGLRAFYLSIPMFLWLFGPIPMVVSCIILVITLYFLDVTREFGPIHGGAVNDDDIDQVV